MSIWLYVLAWNEQPIINYTALHYSKFCDRLILYDNMSTDKTAETFMKYGGTEVRKFDTRNTFSDIKNRSIKNNCWKEARGKADWVIVIDTDEFLYFPKDPR